MEKIGRWDSSVLILVLMEYEKTETVASYTVLGTMWS